MTETKAKNLKELKEKLLKHPELLEKILKEAEEKRKQYVV